MSTPAQLHQPNYTNPTTPAQLHYANHTSSTTHLLQAAFTPANPAMQRLSHLKAMPSNQSLSPVKLMTRQVNWHQARRVRHRFSRRVAPMPGGWLCVGTRLTVPPRCPHGAGGLHVPPVCFGLGRFLPANSSPVPQEGSSRCPRGSWQRWAESGRSLEAEKGKFSPRSAKFRSGTARGGFMGQC